MRRQFTYCVLFPSTLRVSDYWPRITVDIDFSKKEIEQIYFIGRLFKRANTYTAYKRANSLKNCYTCPFLIEQADPLTFG